MVLCLRNIYFPRQSLYRDFAKQSVMQLLSKTDIWQFKLESRQLQNWMKKKILPFTLKIPKKYFSKLARPGLTTTIMFISF